MSGYPECPLCIQIHQFITQERDSVSAVSRGAVLTSQNGLSAESHGAVLTSQNGVSAVSHGAVLTSQNCTSLALSLEALNR